MIRDRIKDFRRVPASELSASPKNWRTHPELQVKAIDGILAEVGYADALLARELPDGSLELIDGHCRKELTPNQEVPVLIVDLDEDEAAKLMTVLDPLAAMAEVNKDALGRLLADVQTDSDALNEMLEGMAVQNGIDLGGGGELVDAEPQIDRAEELQKEWKTERGQLWEIPGKAGTHRVLCGDCTTDTAWGLLKTQGRPFVFTSPPYMDQRTYEGQADLSPCTLSKFIECAASHTDYAVVNLGIAQHDGAVVPYWDEYTSAANRAGWKMLSWNVWVRNNGLSIGNATRMFPTLHEWLLVYGSSVKQLEKTRPNKHGGKIACASNRSRGGVISDAKNIKVAAMGVLRSVIDLPSVTDNAEHPAQFPVGLAVEYIKAFGCDVVDPFLGSGTTLIAAEKLGRICYGMEIEPKYTAVILQRAKDIGLTPRLT